MQQQSSPGASGLHLHWPGHAQEGPTEGGDGGIPAQGLVTLGEWG